MDSAVLCAAWAFSGVSKGFVWPGPGWGTMPETALFVACWLIAVLNPIPLVMAFCHLGFPFPWKLTTLFGYFLAGLWTLIVVAARSGAAQRTRQKIAFRMGERRSMAVSFLTEAVCALRYSLS